MLLRDGIIHIGNGQVLEGYDILIADSKIVKVDKNISADNVEIIEIQGMHVFPGFIDPLSSYGSMDLTFSMKDNNEDTDPIQKDLEIKYAFNPAEIKLEGLETVGITNIGASPGNYNIIGGNISLYNTYEEEFRRFLVREDLGLKGAASEVVKDIFKEKNQVMTKMGLFKRLEDWLEESKKEEGSLSKKVVEGEKPLFIHANTEMEINSVLNVFKDTKVRLVLLGAYEFHKCLKAIKDYGNIGLIIGEQTNLTIRGYYETQLEKARELTSEGIPVSLTLTGEYGPEGKVKYLWNAIEFYKRGLASEEVISYMTLNPAKMLGVDDILGTIEDGKLANMVVYENNPIETYDSRCKKTIINGKIVYQGGFDNATY